MRTPYKIDPCPIIEAIIEVRFDSEMPHDAIFGVFYKEIKDLFSEYDKLPIFQLPEKIRQEEPKLKYSPHYQFKRKDDYKLNFGPRVLTVLNLNEYTGWDHFSKLANEVFSRFLKIDEFRSFERLGVRYLNFFEENIFDISNIKIDFPNNSPTVTKILKSEYIYEAHNVILKVSNSSNLKQNEKLYKGSSLDIDVINKNLGEDFTKKFENYINEAHSIEKKIFFESLQQEYIETLNPTYS